MFIKNLFQIWVVLISARSLCNGISIWILVNDTTFTEYLQWYEKCGLNVISTKSRGLHIMQVFRLDIITGKHECMLQCDTVGSWVTPGCSSSCIIPDNLQWTGVDSTNAIFFQVLDTSLLVIHLHSLQYTEVFFSGNVSGQSLQTLNYDIAFNQLIAVHPKENYELTIVSLSPTNGSTVTLGTIPVCIASEILTSSVLGILGLC